MTAAATPRVRSLASRLVVVGLVQLVLITAAAIAIWVAEGPHGEARPEDHVDLRKLEMLTGTPDALHAELDRLRAERIELSIYTPDKQLLATNVDPPLAIPARWNWKRRGDGQGPPPPGAPPGLTPDERGAPPADGSGGPPPRPPRFGPNRDRTLLVPFHPMGVREQRGVLVARGVYGKTPGWVGPLFMIIAGLIVLVSGAVVTARWIVRPIDRLARTARDLGAGDLSARSRLERSDEIGELGHRFDEMADRLQALMRSEKELFANIAHELRTPLTRIGVALDLATEGDAAAARASLAEIAVDVSELETIIDDILSTLRFEIADRNGAVAQLPLRRAQVPASSVASASAERMRSRHGSRPFEATVPDDLPLVDVDQVLVRRVLDNLLENAHKYSPDPDAKIALSARRDGDRIVYEVRDHGIGIAASDLPLVFTAFFRGDRSRSRETGGVGLGLTLAKRIVDAHAGTIAVDSVQGKGTTVTVTLPVAA